MHISILPYVRIIYNNDQWIQIDKRRICINTLTHLNSDFNVAITPTWTLALVPYY